MEHWYSRPSIFFKTPHSYLFHFHYPFPHTHTHTHIRFHRNILHKMKAAMLRSALRRSTVSSSARATSSYFSSRGFSSGSAPERKVTVLGAAGGIGQPLSLLMKLNPLVSRLALYDIAGTPGVAADVSHINTRSEVPCFSSLNIFLKSWN